MKVAVTSKGKTLDSAVDPRFGRAAGFVIADMESGEFHFADNTQNLSAAQGAGIQAAQNIARHGVDCVVTGHCGPKAFRTLAAAEIDVVLGASGTVAEAIEELRAGALVPSQAADVEGHWV